MSKDENMSYSTSIWGFLRSTEKGAPFSMNLNQNNVEDPDNETARTKLNEKKYISLNKVPVNIDNSAQDKLIVVRDLSPMVKM